MFRFRSPDGGLYSGEQMGRSAEDHANDSVTLSKVLIPPSTLHDGVKELTCKSDWINSVDPSSTVDHKWGTKTCTEGCKLQRT